MKANPIASGGPTLAGAPPYRIVNTLRTPKELPLREGVAAAGPPRRTCS